MGGARIVVTLYQNGIHVTDSDPAFFDDPALVAEMGRAFDAKEDARLYEASSPVTQGVTYAIDYVEFADRRGEVYAKPYLPAGGDTGDDPALHHAGHFKW